MRRDDSAERDDLDRALDALTDGEAGIAERWLRETDGRLRTLDAAFALTPETMSRLWDGLMTTPSASDAEAIEERVVPSLANGVVSGTATAGRWRTQTLPGWRGSIGARAVVEQGRRDGPPLQPEAAEATAARGGWWARRWSVAEVSTVVLLVLILVAGYAAMRLAESGNPDDRDPAGAGLAAPTSDVSILPTPTMAATVTPAAAADLIAPTPTPEPMMGVASSGDAFAGPEMRLVIPPILLSLQVDADGILTGDAAALTEVEILLLTSGIPANGCAAFVLAIGHGGTDDQGQQLGHQINNLIKRVLPAQGSATTFDAIGTTASPRGTVDLRIYQYLGCAGTANVPIGADANPTQFAATHRVSGNLSANLRVAPSPEATIVTTLSPGMPLQFIDQQERSNDGEAWLMVATEDGWIGWIRTIDVEAIGPEATPTSVGGTQRDGIASIQVTAEGDIYVTITADGTVVFDGALAAGDTTGAFIASVFEIFTSDGSLTLFTNENGDSFYMGYGTDEIYTLGAE